MVLVERFNKKKKKREGKKKRGKKRGKRREKKKKKGEERRDDGFHLLHQATFMSTTIFYTNYAVIRLDLGL